MAEVRLRLGRRTFKFLKPKYQVFLDKEGKSALKASYVAALKQSPQLCANVTENEGVGVDHRSGKIRRVTLCLCSRSPADGYTDSLDTITKNNTLTYSTELRRSSYLETHVKHPICSKRCTHYGLKHHHVLTSFVRAYSKNHNNGYTGPLYKSKSAYYDILEVAPTATHAQIKTAYYKQSFKYHPDKNAGSDVATFHFSQISEAYNVLGNKTLRRKYDRGILSQADLQRSGRTAGTEGTASSSGQQTRARHSPSAAGGDQQNIFDFDAYIRAHYGEQLQREKELRQRREKIRQKESQNYEDVKLGRMKEVAVGMLVVMALSILSSLKSSD